MGRLDRVFFSRYTPYVARDLLGCVLVRRLGAKRLAGRIVEVEAYRGAEDPASHAFRGVTGRTRVMFGEAGYAYVYFVYGTHYCLNLTTENEGEPGAVLIRAAEPLQGVDAMKKVRGTDNLRALMSGPGRLTQALGIDLSLNGEDVVTSDSLYVLKGESGSGVATSTRIGVAAGGGIEWRYYVEGSRFVSGGGTHNYRARDAARRGVVG